MLGLEWRWDFRSKALLRRWLFHKDLKEVKAAFWGVFQAESKKVKRRGAAVRGKPMQGCLIGPTQIMVKTLSEMRSLLKVLYGKLSVLAFRIQCDYTAIQLYHIPALHKLLIGLKIYYHWLHKLMYSKILF